MILVAYCAVAFCIRIRGIDLTLGVVLLALPLEVAFAKYTVHHCLPYTNSPEHSVLVFTKHSWSLPLSDFKSFYHHRFKMFSLAFPFDVIFRHSELYVI